MKRSIHITTSRCLIAAALVAATTHATPAPAERIYFTVTMGLSAEHGLEAHCMVFSEDRLCSTEGELCGHWQRSRPGSKRAEIRFQLEMVDESGSIRIDGRGRLDARGLHSSLGGSGRARFGGSKLNFSFAARESSPAECATLRDRFNGVEPPPGRDIEGSGVLISESRAVADFHAVTITNSGRLLIEQTGEESLVIRAEDNVMPVLRSEVVDGRLELGIEPGNNVRSREEVEYRLTVRDLDELRISGSIRAEAERIDTDTWLVELDGSSRLTVSGETDGQQLTLSGSSRYLAVGLESRTATATMSGSSRASVRVAERLDGRIRDAAVLEYHGDPEVDVQISGPAVVRKAGS